eukprot:354459-Chlamydomonas_euryale.AAC.2
MHKAGGEERAGNRGDTDTEREAGGRKLDLHLVEVLLAGRRRCSMRRDRGGEGCVGEKEEEVRQARGRTNGKGEGRKGGWFYIVQGSETQQEGRGREGQGRKKGGKGMQERRQLRCCLMHVHVRYVV